MNDYYVYVYIDPGNYEEFYYGKGKDRRKEAHLFDEKDSENSKRIRAIQQEGLEPIIRVVASGLSESEAFLVEKTLLWKLGKTLTNKSTGRFADKFRPRDRLHLELSGFDFNTEPYTTTHVRASLEAQPNTLRFLEAEFEIDLQSLRERRTENLP